MPLLVQNKCICVGPGERVLCAAGGFVTDGFIGNRERPCSSCIAIIMFENELGATQCDKYFQGQNYYARLCLDNEDVPARLMGCFRSLLLELQGPYMR